MDTFDKKLRLKKQLVTIINESNYDLDYSLDEYLEVFDNVIDDILYLEPDEISMEVLEDEIYFNLFKNNYKIYIIYFLDDYVCAYNMLSKRDEYVSSRFISDEVENDVFDNFKKIFSIILRHFK